MKSFKLLASLVSVLPWINFSILPVNASQFRRIHRSLAQNTYQIPVSPLGVAISFIEAGETVEYVQLNPMGEITVSGNRPLCSGLDQILASAEQSFGNRNGNLESDCSQPVQVLFLRRIAPIFVPGQLPSPTGNALMQVVTRGPAGSFIYQFELVPTGKKPDYTLLSITGTEPVAASQVPFVPPPPQNDNGAGSGVPDIPPFGVPRDRPPSGGGFPSPPSGGGFPSVPSGGGFPVVPPGGGFPSPPSGGGFPVVPPGGGFPSPPSGGGFPVVPPGGGFPQ